MTLMVFHNQARNAVGIIEGRLVAFVRARALTAPALSTSSKPRHHPSHLGDGRPGSARHEPSFFLIRSVAVLILCAASACHAPGSDSAPDAGVGASNAGAGGPDAGAATELVVDGSALALCPADDDSPSVVMDCCAEERLVGVSAVARTVLDLREIDTESELAAESGTCRSHFAARFDEPMGMILPLDRALYPLKIVLPAVDGEDPYCSACLDFGAEPPTAFGIAFETDDDERYLGAEGRTRYVLSISVPPPWYIVSGGYGEAYPWPCLSGYQEFGHARSCMTLPYGGFGIATGDPQAPSVEALVDVHEVPEDVHVAELAPGACCMLRGSAE